MGSPRLSLPPLPVVAPPELSARNDERQILILAPTGNDAQLTSQVLGKSGITVHTCRDVAELCQRLAGPCAAILLAEETLRTNSIAHLVDALAKQPAWSDLPVIIITSGGEADQDRLRRLAAFGPGNNVTLLERPFRPGTLSSTVAVALRSRQRQYQVRDLLQSVRASEERYQHILASISDAFIAINRDWTITYVNDSYLRLVAPLGLGAADLLGKNLWEALPVSPEAGKRFRRAMAEQKADTMEVFREPLGLWLDLRIYPSRETLTVYHRDITARKRQEAELADLAQKIRDQARTFDATLSHITDFAYTFDVQGRFTYINKPLLDLWGLTLEQAVGRDFFELKYPPELAQKLSDQIRSVARTGKSVRDETPYTNPAGAQGYYEYIFNPIFSAEGAVVAVAGSTRDITERKRIEEQLRNSDARISAIIAHSPVGMYLVDATLQIQQVNEKAEPAFGSIKNLLGRPLGEVMRLLWPEAVAAQIESRFRHTLASGESFFESGFAQTRLDGITREHYDWQIHRIRLPDGGFGAVCYFIDISTHIAAQEKIREARDAAEQASRAKDDFLAALSHELRTPLNPVLLLASDAAANESLAPDLRADFETIAKNVQLEARLIDDLLDLTRITRGKLALDRRPIAARKIVQDAIDNVRPEIREKEITLEVSWGPENPTVLGDAVRLQQVFWNVLRNAVKFTPARGRIALATRMDPAAGRLIIEITDSGAGMTAAEISRIFDAFAQGDHANPGSSHRFGGLGLGLAISRSLVEMHAGAIRATSPGLGAGSSFTIELPIIATPQPAETLPGLPTPRQTNSPLPGLRVLLVEDHDPTRAVLTHLLRARHYVVVSASSLQAARELGLNEPFDLLITDIGLPDGDGYTLMSELAAQRKLRGIALTGYGAEQDLARAREAGFTAHLTKPVSVVMLDRALDQLMGASTRPEKT